jgi:hypothetical protein
VSLRLLIPEKILFKLNFKENHLKSSFSCAGGYLLGEFSKKLGRGFFGGEGVHYAKK